jgi:phosphomannomutase
MNSESNPTEHAHSEWPTAIRDAVSRAASLTPVTRENCIAWMHDSFRQVFEDGRNAHEIIQDLVEHERWDELQDRFFETVSPGTAGIRGKLGVGSARINEATVGMFAQAHANYLAAHPLAGRDGILVGGDSRKGSFDPVLGGPGFLQRMVAEIYAARGIPVFLSDRPLPTPVVSFAVNEVCFEGRLPLSAAINTASHNPATDNGYKIYEPGGHQVVGAEFKKNLERELEKISHFGRVKRARLRKPWPENRDRLRAVIREQGSYLLPTDGAPVRIVDSEEIVRRYAHKIRQVRFFNRGMCADSSAGDGERFYFADPIRKALEKNALVITALNGSGWPAIRTLLESHGLKENVHFFGVPAENVPDGDFPVGHGEVRGKPNPEFPENFYRAVEVAGRVGARYVFAADPDADRIGIGTIDPRADDPEAGYANAFFFNGNQQLCLCLAFLGLTRAFGPQDVFMQTRVSSRLYSRIAGHLGGRLLQVLVGFKYFGQISNHFVERLVESENRDRLSRGTRGFSRADFSGLDFSERSELFRRHGIPRFVHGGEESMGQNMFDYVFDKDTPATVALFAEMIGFLGMDLEEKKRMLSGCRRAEHERAPEPRMVDALLGAGGLEDLLDRIHGFFGYSREDLRLFRFEGESGDRIKNAVMRHFRETPLESWNDRGGFGGYRLSARADYLVRLDEQGAPRPRAVECLPGNRMRPLEDSNAGYAVLETPEAEVPVYPFAFPWIEGEPPRELDSSDFLVFWLENGDEICLRPSGTEPYVKLYLNFNGRSEKSDADAAGIRREVQDKIRRVADRLEKEIQSVEA